VGTFVNLFDTNNGKSQDLSPSGVSLIGDSVCRSNPLTQYVYINGFLTSGTNVWGTYALSARHNNMANMLFIDGHAGRVGVQDCVQQRICSVSNDAGVVLYGP
jgi:prepilin-type processing-associated H-X9-DG protein